jgi:hypothetical protein
MTTDNVSVSRILATALIVVLLAVGLSVVRAVPASAACDVKDYHTSAVAVATGLMRLELDAWHDEMINRGLFSSGIHYGGDIDIAEGYGWIWDEATCMFVRPGSTTTTMATTTTTRPPPLPGDHLTGLVDPSQGRWHLYNHVGIERTAFFYGNPGDYPFMGDWDGDGIETPGMYRQSDGYVYLKNSNTQGIANIRFFFGNPGDVPIAGDFNNDGFDTVSIYRPSNQTFYIINELGENDGGLGPADFSYVFGDPGDRPFVGDFNGNGQETVGLHRESTGLVYYRNEHLTGNADNQFIFGDPGDRLFAGDWTGTGVFTPALFRRANTTMYFKYSNSQGNADAQFVPGTSDLDWLPVSGRR